MARFPSFSLGGRERSILEDIATHLAMVKECVVAYQYLVTNCAQTEDRSRPSRELLAQVFSLEAKAKEKRRAISGRIAEGAFFGGVREDILNLIQTDDKIADKAKDAARLLAMTIDARPEMRTILGSEHMTGFQKNLLASVTALESLIQALREDDKHGILSKVRAVEDFEEAADTEKDHLLRSLLDSPDTVDPVSIIEMRDFIFASDDIADNAESASDVVIVLVAKGYG